MQHSIFNVTVLFDTLDTEKAFDIDAGRAWANETKAKTFLISLLYVACVFSGRRFMKDRSALSLRAPLFLWNAALATFSIGGAYNLGSELVTGVVRHGWRYSICDQNVYYGASGFWCFAFCASKIVELGDTAFIVVRKQPLMFLHWFHHITVMIYTFYSYGEFLASGRWFMSINYTIHSIMYSYYAVRAAGLRPPRLVNMSITALQIVQMVAGMAVQIAVMTIKSEPGGAAYCRQSFENVLFGTLMYLSYLILFVQFFYVAYGARPKNAVSFENGSATKKSR